MRITTALITFVLMAGTAMAAEKKTAKQKVPTPNTKIELPAGATRIDDNTYSHTDAKGTKWIYRQSPFGWARRDAEADRAAHESATKVETKVIDDGDSLRFERPGPFGLYKWTKKKSELTRDEQALWKQSSDKTAAK